MSYLDRTIAWVLVAVIANGCAGGIQPAQLIPVPEASGQAGITLLVLGDNQEHNVLGSPLMSMSPVSEKWLTSVAMRSPLANAGSSLLLREAIRFGRQQGAEIVLHLGDAADISCPAELRIAFDAIEAESGQGWFMAPGNHDGLMAGTTARFQPTTSTIPSPLYEEAPAVGFPGAPRAWQNACASPGPNGIVQGRDILTKGDATTAYVNRIKARSGVSSRVLGVDSLTISGTLVTCPVEEITVPAFDYRAIARICPRTPTQRQTFVGPYASFVVQRFVVSETQVLLLDTSHYPNPFEGIVGFGGSLGDRQLKLAANLIGTPSPNRTIIAGHHPLDNLPKHEQRWIAERARRYLSAHTHMSTTLREHAVAAGVVELNVGSIVDYPSQAVMLRAAPTFATFRVVGADSTRTRWPGYLEPCFANRQQWALPEAAYRRYQDGPYAMSVIRALSEAAARSPANSPVRVPVGNSREDWVQLEQSLRDLREATGESRVFWSCQTYYAAEATRLEKTIVERLTSRAKGASALGEWFRFDP